MTDPTVLRIRVETILTEKGQIQTPRNAVVLTYSPTLCQKSKMTKCVQKMTLVSGVAAIPVMDLDVRPSKSCFQRV